MYAEFVFDSASKKTPCIQSWYCGLGGSTCPLAGNRSALSTAYITHVVANCLILLMHCTRLPAAFARADLVVCRSGASTVAEIAAAGKPAVFVPFPRAADDHQRVNAEALAKHGAAVVVEESKLEGVWLAETIAALLQDPQRLERMGQAARRLSHPNAAREIAAMAARVAGLQSAAD